MKRSLHDHQKNYIPNNNNNNFGNNVSKHVQFNHIQKNNNVFTGRRYLNFENVPEDTIEDQTIQSSSSSSSSSNSNNSSLHRLSNNKNSINPVLEISPESMEQIIRKRATLQKISIAKDIQSNQKKYSTNMLDQFAVEEEYNNMSDSTIAKQRRRTYEKNIQLYKQYTQQHILYVQNLEIPYSDPMKYISDEDRLLLLRNSVTETFIINFQPYIINEKNKTGPDDNSIWDSELDCRFVWHGSEHMRTFMEMFDCESTGKMIPVLSFSSVYNRIKIIFSFNIIDTMTEFNDRHVFVTIVIDDILDKNTSDRMKCCRFVTYFFNICKNDVHVSI